MPALRATNVYLTITWLGVVTHRRDIEIETEPRKKLDLDWDGVTGAAYRGRTRASDSRVLQQHPRGTQITNVRQLSIVSQEEIDEIGRDMGLAHFNPQWLGATMVVSGCPDFSHLPPSSRLHAPQGTTLVVDMQNYPCHQVGMTIERDLPGQGKSFKAHAKGKRGVTAWVERPGELALGDVLRLHCPEQRAWQPDGQQQFSWA